MTISSSRRLLCRISLSLFLLCTLLPPLPTFAQSSVVIGEVQWAGSEASSADEWIELWNLGNVPFSLNGYQLRGVGGGSNLAFTAKDLIPANSAYLIANYPRGDSKTTLAIEAGVVSTTLSITNEKTTIELIDGAGTVLDHVSWDKTAPGGSSASPRSSLLRTLSSLDTAVGTWTSATISKNLATTFIQYGTPGFCDSCNITPVTPTSPPNVSPPPDQTETTPFVDPLITDNLLPAEDAFLSEEQAQELQDFLASSTAAELIDTPPSSNGLAPGDPDPALLAETIIATITTTTETIPTTMNPDTSEISTSTVETVPVPETPVSASTSVALPEMSLSTSTSLVIPTMVTTTEIATSTAATTTAPLLEQAVIVSSTPLIITPTPVAPLLHFNEILANPLNNVEWIELATSNLSAPTQLLNWTIRDSKRTLVSLSNTQRLLWDPATQLLLVSFPKGVLADKGTHLFLYNASGGQVDDIIIPATTKNQSFARVTIAGAEWKKTLSPTPGKENSIQLTLPTTKTVVTTKKGTIVVSTTSSTKNAVGAVAKNVPAKKKAVAQPPTVNKKSATTTVITNLAAKASKIKKTPKKTTTTTTKTIVKKATPVKKVPKKKTTASAEKPIQEVALADLSSMHASTRVRVTGTVATLPRLLNNQTFVIQTDDGRGLYVYGNTKQTSPPFRSQIEITGTLTSNDDGLALHMYAADRWRLVDLEHAVQPHLPDLIAPAAEDAWSYVQLRGHVIEAKATRITMLNNGTTITVSIRPLVHYRAERLQKGDEIEVAGILDTRKDMLVILPRLAEEIRVIQSAPPKATAQTSGTSLPPWLPLGVAGISVAATQGARRYWQYRRERILRLQARATAPSLPSTGT